MPFAREIARAGSLVMPLPGLPAPPIVERLRADTPLLTVEGTAIGEPSRVGMLYDVRLAAYARVSFGR